MKVNTSDATSPSMVTPVIAASTRRASEAAPPHETVVGEGFVSARVTTDHESGGDKTTKDGYLDTNAGRTGLQFMVGAHAGAGPSTVTSAEIEQGVARSEDIVNVGGNGGAGGSPSETLASPVVSLSSQHPADLPAVPATPKRKRSKPSTPKSKRKSKAVRRRRVENRRSCNVSDDGSDKESDASELRHSRGKYHRRSKRMAKSCPRILGSGLTKVIMAIFRHSV